MNITTNKLGDLVNYVNVIINILHEEYNTIEYKIDIFDPNYLIETDLHRLSQIIITFVKNGLKYSISGTVILSIVKEENNIVFRVIDTGPGIPQNMAKQIFRTYFHENTNEHGFGTYYAKFIADQLGYHIGFTTELGKGSCFFIKVPDTIKETHDLKSIQMDEINEINVSSF